jgi:hypothetical protein
MAPKNSLLARLEGDATQARPAGPGGLMEFLGPAAVPAEPVTLEDYERIIERGMSTFMDVGNALVTIRDQRLYRRDFATFESYCKERWGFTRSRAYRLIDAVGIAGLLPAGEPANEAQLRQLGPIRDDPEAVAAVWAAANASVTNGQPPSAKVIRETRDALYPKPIVEDPPADVPAPRIPPQKPLADTAKAATRRLGRDVGELVDVTLRPRFSRNRDAIATAVLDDLVAHRDSLQQVIDQLMEATQH